MRAVRRSALLSLSALCALTSCGIPSTGPVEAGGPASGAVPTIRVYFVMDGALVAVPRSTVAPVDVESAVRVLLQGPNDAERTKRLRTLLPLPVLAPSAFATSPALPTESATPVPSEASGTSDFVKVTRHADRVSIDLSAAGKPTDLAAAQLICTAVAAQRVAAPEAAPLPVTVTVPGGRHIGETGTRCPGG